MNNNNNNNSLKYKYKAGCCNLNLHERIKRFHLGILGIILFSIMLFIVNSNYGLIAELLLIFPIAISTLGFIQAKTGFCIQYGFEGKTSIGKKNKKKRIKNHKYHILDRNYAWHMLIQVLIISTIILILFITSKYYYFS